MFNISGSCKQITDFEDKKREWGEVIKFFSSRMCQSTSGMTDIDQMIDWFLPKWVYKTNYFSILNGLSFQQRFYLEER